MNYDERRVQEHTSECVASSLLYNPAIKKTSSVVLAVWWGRAGVHHWRGARHRRKPADPNGSVGGVGNRPTIHNDICIRHWIDYGPSDCAFRGLCSAALVLTSHAASKEKQWPLQPQPHFTQQASSSVL